MKKWRLDLRRMATVSTDSHQQFDSRLLASQLVSILDDFALLQRSQVQANDLFAFFNTVQFTYDSPMFVC